MSYTGVRRQDVILGLRLPKAVTLSICNNSSRLQRCILISSPTNQLFSKPPTDYQDYNAQNAVKLGVVFVETINIIISESELTFTFAMPSPVRLSVVCNVRAPYSGGCKFRFYSILIGTLDICDLSVKLLRRSSQGKPAVGGDKRKRSGQNNDSGPLEGYISETVQDRYNLLLITNRKSYMSF